jgi:hypothetical protein
MVRRCDTSPSSASTEVTKGRPSERVPVLSKRTVSTRCAFSRLSMSRIRIPARAAAPVPATRAVGAARPRAQGQAITSTDTAASIAWEKEPSTASQANRVNPATPSTRGTKAVAARSTKRCSGTLRACASSTRAMIRARVDWAATRSATMCRVPPPFIVPPVTASPGALSSGSPAPVIIEESTVLSPRTMTPSTGMRS